MRQRNLAISTNLTNAMSSGRFDSQYFVGAFASDGHSISSHSSASRARRTRTRAKRDDSHSAVPSRHRMVLQALLSRASAMSFTDTKSVSSSRAFGNLRPGLGPVPGLHTIGLD